MFANRCQGREYNDEDERMIYQIRIFVEIGNSYLFEWVMSSKDSMNPIEHENSVPSKYQEWIGHNELEWR